MRSTKWTSDSHSTAAHCVAPMTSQVRRSTRSDDAASFAMHKLWRDRIVSAVALSIAAALIVVIGMLGAGGSGSISGSTRSHRPPVGGSMPQPQPQPRPPPPRSLRIPVRRVPIDLYPQFAAARRARLAEPFFTRDQIVSPASVLAFDPSAASTQRRRLLQDAQSGNNSSSTAAADIDSSSAEAASSSTAAAAESSSAAAESSAAAVAASSSAAAESSSAATESSSAAAESSSGASAALSSSGDDESSSAAASDAASSSSAAALPSSTAAAPAAAASSTGSTPTSGLPVSTTAAGQHGRVHLRDYSDYMYIGVIGVGTPPQFFGCVFDTGSADTWVFSSALPQSLHHPWLHYFNPAASATFVPVGRSWDISYGKGSARGAIQSDSVWVGGMEVAAQHFGLATTADSATFSLPNEPIDGLMGLGFQQLATSGFGPTLIENALDRGVIDRRAFAFHMQPSNDDPSAQDLPHAPAGTLDEIATDRVDAAKHPASYFQLGDPSSSAADSDATEMAPRGWIYTPIIPPHEVDGRWVVELGGLSADGKDISDFCSALGGATKPCFAWVDTGSSFILLPAAKFEAIMSAIIARRPDCSVSAGSSTEDQKVICTVGWTTHLLPTLALRFGSGSAPAPAGSDGASPPAVEEFLLTPSQYALPTTLIDSVTGAESSVLLLGFSPLHRAAAVAYDEIILGDTFLKNYATLFDMGPKPASGSGVPDGMQGRIGFARGEPAWVVGFALMLGVMAATCALMLGAMWIVRRKHAGRVAAEEAAAAAASGVAAPAPVAAPSALPSRLFGRSSRSAVLDDAGEGEARPRGYAQVSGVGGDDSSSAPASPSLGRDLEAGNGDGAVHASRSSYSDTIRSDAVELTRIGAPSAASDATTARPPSPSRLSRLSSDDRAAMEEL